MDISKIVYGPKFTLDVPEGELSDEGQSEILSLLDNNTPVSSTKFKAALPDDWSWAWKVVHGTYAGTLSKRIQSLVFKKFDDLKLSEHIVTQIGNIANQHTLKGRSFIFDFDRELNWQAGDYGDDGSCFWGGKGYIFPTMQRFGAFSIRLYQKLGSDKEVGSGRALLLPYLIDPVGYQPERWANPDAICVINGYGKDQENYGKSKISAQRYGNMQVMDYARLLAMFLGVSYQRARLYINGSFQDPLFVNNEGMTVVVGPADVVKPWLPKGPLGNKTYHKLDIVWDRIEMGKFMVDCHNCGHKCAEKPFGGLRQLVVGPDKNSYCQQCYDQLFAPCFGGCGKRLSSKNAAVQVMANHLAHVPGLTNGNSRVVICPDCQPRLTFRCARCRTKHHLSDRVEFHIANGGRQPKRSYVCNRCAEDSLFVTHCPACTRGYPIGQLIQLDEGGQRLFGPCPQCRHRAKKHALGEAEEEVGAMPLVWQAPPEIDKLILGTAITNRLRGEAGPVVDWRAAPKVDLDGYLQQKLSEYARYIDIHGWRPVPAKPYLQMLIATGVWSDDPTPATPYLQSYLDERLGQGELTISRIEVKAKSPDTTMWNVYFQLSVGPDGISYPLFDELLDRLISLAQEGPLPQTGDITRLNLGYLSRGDSLVAVMNVLQAGAEQLQLGWPAIDQLRADHDQSELFIQFVA